MFAILGILLSAQQAAVLHLLGNIPKDAALPESTVIVNRYLPLLITGSRRAVGLESGQEKIRTATPCEPRWHMVFTWQCPVMFMSYSVCTFLFGLTVLVITPLIHLREHGWTGQATVCMICHQLGA